MGFRYREPRRWRMSCFRCISITLQRRRRWNRRVAWRTTTMFFLYRGSVRGIRLIRSFRFLHRFNNKAIITTAMIRLVFLVMIYLFIWSNNSWMLIASSPNMWVFEKKICVFWNGVFRFCLMIWCWWDFFFF